MIAAMTLGSFILGIIMMAAGFFMIRKTELLLRYLGDISELFGLVNASWLSWKIFGVFFIVVGFLIAFGLLQGFFNLTLGTLFNFSPANSL